MKIGMDSKIYPSAKLCYQELISIGSRVIIDDFVFIAGKSGVFIGDFVHIGTHSLISGQGEVCLESFSGLSSGVKLFSSNLKTLRGLGRLAPKPREAGPRLGGNLGVTWRN